MKRTVVICCCFLLAGSNLSTQQYSHWKGKIEYEDDVKVVANPAEPLYGEIELELTRVFSIGSSNSDSTMFYKVMDIEVIILSQHDMGWKSGEFTKYLL